MIKTQATAMLPLLAASYHAASTQPLDSVWRSQGWGFVYEIRGARLQAFEVTSTTCVAGFKAERQRGWPRFNVPHKRWRYLLRHRGARWRSQTCRTPNRTDQHCNRTAGDTAGNL